MADSEKQSLTAQQEQPQVIIDPIQPPPSQNIQYVYTTQQQQPQQQIIVIPQTDSTIARQVQQQEINKYEAGYGHHAPTHHLNTAPADTHPQEGESSTIVIVKWGNLKLPVPLNHATFMRKVWLTLVLQLIFTAGMIAMCMYVDAIREWVVANYWMW